MVGAAPAVGVAVGAVTPVVPGAAVGDATADELVRPLRSAESAGSSAGTGKSGQ
jgi:hypothetical protein